MATMYGNAKNNVMSGTETATTFYGRDGHDTIVGRSFADALFGENGNDTLRGGGGNDYLAGGSGIDYLFGGDGDDKMNFTTGSVNYSSANRTYETMDGGRGSDNVHVDVAGSMVNGTAADTLHIGATGTGYSIGISNDMGERATLATATAVESFTLRADGPALNFIGNMDTHGGAINMTATDKDDIFCGGKETDVVNLGAGNDTFYFSDGWDTVTAGAGDDTLVLNAGYNGNRFGTVTDFKVGEDTLVLDGWAPGELQTVEDANGTMICGSSLQITLVGVHGFDLVA